MRGVKFNGYNVDMGKPRDWDDSKGECVSLPVLRTRQDNGLLTYTSVWTLSDEERAAIAAGANVALICVGVQPPVSLHAVHEPEAPDAAPVQVP